MAISFGELFLEAMKGPLSLGLDMPVGFVRCGTAPAIFVWVEQVSRRAHSLDFVSVL